MFLLVFSPSNCVPIPTPLIALIPLCIVHSRIMAVLHVLWQVSLGLIVNILVSFPTFAARIFPVEEDQKQCRRDDADPDIHQHEAYCEAIQ